jgi:Flp pilus assembly protein CpaB
MLLKDVAIRFERYPSHQLPMDIVRDVKLFADRVTITALPGGLPIGTSNLGAPEELMNPVIGKIPSGMRAMTVKVDATSAVEGWARTGSIVDVLLVEKTRTTVVAERVRVLSTERSTSSFAEQNSAPIPSTVTLLVTQEQCLAVNTAVPLARIAFALRSTGDESAWRSTRFSAQELSGDSADTPAKVGGAVTFSVDGKPKTYALVDGAWISSDEAPAGFLGRINPSGGKR